MSSILVMQRGAAASRKGFVGPADLRSDGRATSSSQVLRARPAAAARVMVLCEHAGPDASRPGRCRLGRMTGDRQP